MLNFIIFIALLFKLNCAEKTFGEFTVTIEGVKHPFENHLKNDIVNYRFILSKAGKHETQLTANFEFHRNITDLKVQKEMGRKNSDKMASEYQTECPLLDPVSLCFGSRKEYPNFQASLHPSIDQRDCSIEKGKHTLEPYFLEKELRYYAGNETLYGRFSLKLIFVEKDETNPVFAVEMFYTVKDANLAATANDPPKSKTTRKNKGK